MTNRFRRSVLLFALPCLALSCCLPDVVKAAPVQKRTAPTIATERTAKQSVLSYSDASLVTNANAEERGAVNELLARLQNALSARDANALGFFGIAPGSRTFAPRFKMTHLAVAPGGALARLAFDTTGVAAVSNSVSPAAGENVKRAVANANVSSGVSELWLARRGASDFTLTDRHWTAPADAASKLNEAAFDAWNTLPASSLSSGALIDLVAERRGGRWIPLRASNIWTGALLDATRLAQAATQMQSEGGALLPENARSATARQAAIATRTRHANASHQVLAAATNRPRTSQAKVAATRFDSALSVNAFSARQPSPDAASSRFSNVTIDASARIATARAWANEHGPGAANATSARRRAVISAPLESATQGRIVLREATTSGAPADDRAPDAARRAWNVAPWIRAQMNRYEGEMAGTAHFLMQNGPRGWVGLDSVWEHNRTLPDATEKAARQARAALESDRYLSADLHRDLARALFATGVYGEAADEIQKALALQPDIATKTQIAQFESQREFDPQILAVRQVENEVKISVAKNHPNFLIPALLNEWKTRPSVLSALRISLEYSRLAADRVSSDWLEQAHDLGAQARRNLSDSDHMWINLLEEQLQNRRRMAARKPANIIRSTLFTVRTNANDLSATRLLAGLEAAQHTIYADFGIPMSNSEVVLWSNQRDFQRHTGQVSGTATSEFVTALTLTQLVKTESGPEVLSEEINFYTDPRADSLSTIAHEYGHVAVRHLCRGREVPDWINEGIATVVEGGYEDYLPRVREAAKKNKLLSMQEMQAWQIDSPDGERAFLAYSQANSMLDYIKARWGRQAVLDLLRQIGQDRAPDDAIKVVLGQTPEQLWNDWRREGIR